MRALRWPLDVLIMNVNALAKALGVSADTALRLVDHGNGHKHWWLVVVNWRARPQNIIDHA